ncbi:MAG: phage tail terminator-like protein [Planctomycetota bacterium]
MAGFAFDTRAIRQAFRSRLLEIEGLPTIIAWQNRPFEPPTDGSIWMRETLLVAYDLRAAVGLVQSGGQYRVDLFGPDDSGTEQLEDLSRKLTTSFVPGWVLYQDGRDSLEVLSTSRTPRRRDGIWGHLPVSITWTAMAELSAGE